MKFKLLNLISDLLFPRFCLNCGHMGEFWCENCYQHLSFLTDYDISFVFQQLEQQKNIHCFIDQAQALFAYDLFLKKIIHTFKYKGVKDLSETLAFWLYQFLPLPAVDIITYIPIHARRLDERGYNQAKLIATSLAKKMQLPCLPLLKRTLYQEKQALSKNKQERLNKSENIFTLQKAVAKNIDKKKRILIIDDIITSGATLNQAGKILKQAGFIQVQALALAHGN